MMPLPPHTKRFSQLCLGDIGTVERVISAGHATEDRGQLPIWREISASAPEKVAWLEATVGSFAKLTVGTEESDINLSDEAALDQLVSCDSLVLDISGLPHAVWAPVLKAAHRLRTQTRVVYAEPDSYKEHQNPVSASIFDLSVSLGGLAPLPGFARLAGPADEEKCLFIALLGFEGNRPGCLVQHVEPTPKIIPIVGVPGFQIEYPMFTIACNRDFLDDYRSHSDIRYARASCPFEVCATLKDILRDYSDHYLYIAPVGTKPHALGAVLFALENPDNSEIMFDHPVRKAGRTAGVGVIHVYELGSFNEL